MTGNARDILIPTGTSQGNPSIDSISQDPRLETAFLTYDQGSLNPAIHGDPDSVQRHLAHLVQRQPKALRLHIQRILLHLERKDRDILGALWDLFLVLGDAGKPLRRRMLQKAKPLLTEAVYRVFEHYLDNQANIGRAWQAQLVGSAVLHAGITGSTRLLEKSSNPQAQVEDPLKVAEEQLACGQTDLAQITLEQALLADSKRLDLHLALLEIYRHSRDLTQVKRIRAQLEGQTNPADNEWHRLQQRLEEETETR
jgi:hypothetical protein